MLTANYLYAGYSDYFSGHGCDDNEYLLYAYYGRDTSLRDIIEELVEDSWSGPAGEELPNEVTTDDVREALGEMLSNQGREDYVSGALAECSRDFADANRLTECPECYSDDLGIDKCFDCDYAFEDDDYEDYCESPVFIVLLEYED